MDYSRSTKEAEWCGARPYSRRQGHFLQPSNQRKYVDLQQGRPGGLFSCSRYGEILQPAVSYPGCFVLLQSQR